MEVLHTIWDTNTLHFWVESLDELNFLFNPSFNLKKSSFIDKYPNSRNITQILKVLKIAGLDNINSSNYKENSLNLAVPSKVLDEIKPISNLISKDDFTNSSLLNYEIDSISIEPFCVLDFMLEKDNFNLNYLNFSSSIEFWRKTAKFALELIRCESFLPTIHVISKESNKTQFVGKWKSLIQGKDKSHLTQLVQEIPRYCFNFLEKEISSIKLIVSFIDQIIDGFIRNKLGVFLPERSFSQKSDEITDISKKWFESLFDPSNQIIEVSTDSFDHFAGIIKAWINKAILPSEEYRFRTCFKLDPPNLEEEETSWKIQFLLQAENDLSLIIPAEKIWNYTSNTLDYLEKKFENPQERLLIDLAKISDFYSKIDDCLHFNYPSNITLTKKEAFNFLENIVPILEENEFGVFLPSWWKNSQEKIILKLKLSDDNFPSQKESLFRLNEFLKFEWEIAIGDSSISIEEFEKLSELKIPFVRIRGKWIKFDKEEIREILDKIKTNYNQITFGDALQHSLTNNLVDSDSFNFELDDRGLFNEFKTKIGSTSKIEKLNIPNGFVGELRPYQIDGFSWINYLKDFGFGACLADDMGLGKTIQIIAFLLYEKENNRYSNQPSLIICPTSIVGNWYKEIKRFAPDFKVYIFHGTNRPRRVDFEKTITNYDIMITTYSLALKDKTSLSDIFWENIILDEAQNIKNPYAKQTRAIKSLRSNYKIALTGTPIENRLSELWSILDFLNPRYLGTLKEFNDKFGIPIEKDFSKIMREQLAKIINPFILRRLKKDPTIIQDLPEKFENKVFCSLNEEQAVLYEAVVKDLFNQLNETQGIHRKGLVLATITKLKQICNHPAQFMHEKKIKLNNRSCKFERLEEMLQEILDNKEKTLIFTQYKELGEMLVCYLERKFEGGVLFLSGETPQKTRDEMVRKFQENTNPDGPKIFILSIKAGGVGLNLTAANHVIHIDRWWNPAVENQATDRVFRIGQEKNVMVHKFVCIGTLEESINHLIEQKKELANSIITTGDIWLTELSTEDLRNVLSLRSVL